MFKPTDRPPAYGVIARQLDEPFVDHARTAGWAIRKEAMTDDDVRTALDAVGEAIVAAIEAGASEARIRLVVNATLDALSADDDR